MTAEIANNITWGAIFMITGAAFNIVSVILLIYAARTNTKSARLLLEASARLRGDANG